MSIFHLPDLGEGLAEARIVEWHVQPDDEVKAEQLLVSVETAKAVVDIPSPQGGHIVALLAKAGETVATHAPLVEFSGGLNKTDNGSVVGVLAQSDTIRHESFVIGRHRHTEARLQQSRERRASRAVRQQKPALFNGGEPLDLTRKAMAENLARAHRNVVPVTLMLEAEILFEDRRELTARLVRALVAAAAAEPALNAWYDGSAQKRLLHETVHVGIAVDTPHGLFVPVLKDAGQLSLGQIAREVASLKKAALEHHLSPVQLSGATLTLSNFGALAGRFATPLVTPPQVAILGAGHARDSVLPSGDGTRTARLLPLSLSFDHRAVTGGEAARFLDAVAADLARPD
jgi:pyruvate dehydrogenase E2 component (dihydrolipoamide acetyltransferase)